MLPLVNNQSCGKGFIKLFLVFILILSLSIAHATSPSRPQDARGKLRSAKSLLDADPDSGLGL